jgi:hypothetical protein
VVVVVHFADVGAGGVVEAGVETVAEGPGGGAGKDLGGVGELAGEGVDVVEVEVFFSVEDEE